MKDKSHGVLNERRAMLGEENYSRKLRGRKAERIEKMGWRTRLDLFNAFPYDDCSLRNAPIR